MDDEPKNQGKNLVDGSPKEEKRVVCAFVCHVPSIELRKSFYFLLKCLRAVKC